MVTSSYSRHYRRCCKYINQIFEDKWKNRNEVGREYIKNNRFSVTINLASYVAILTVGGVIKFIPSISSIREAVIMSGHCML